MIHSIFISEVKDTKKSCFAGTIENVEPKKTSKFHLEFNFNNFQEKRNSFFRLISIIVSRFGLTLLDLTLS